MVKAKHADAIAAVTLAAARVEQARLRLEAIHQCPALLDPSAPWTRCKLIDRHHDAGHQPAPTPHRTGPDLEWWT